MHAYQHGRDEKNRWKDVTREVCIASALMEMNLEFASALSQESYRRKAQEEGAIPQPPGLLEAKVYAFGYKFG